MICLPKSSHFHPEESDSDWQWDEEEEDNKEEEKENPKITEQLRRAEIGKFYFNLVAWPLFLAAIIFPEAAKACAIKIFWTLIHGYNLHSDMISSVYAAYGFWCAAILFAATILIPCFVFLNLFKRIEDRFPSILAGLLEGIKNFGFLLLLACLFKNFGFWVTVLVILCIPLCIIIFSGLFSINEEDQEESNYSCDSYKSYADDREERDRERGERT